MIPIIYLEEQPDSRPQWQPESQPESLDERALPLLGKGQVGKRDISAALMTSHRFGLGRFEGRAGGKYLACVSGFAMGCLD